jgi:peroxiredoxin Q/BCP
VSTEYDSVMTYEGSKYSARNTYLIDPDGKIAKIFLKVNPADHSEKVLAALTSLQKH